MRGYNFYAEKIVPIMVEHHLIGMEEQDVVSEYIRQCEGVYDA